MSSRARLCAVLAANLTLVAVLVVVGAVAGSLGVLAEGADYLADSAGITVTLLALHLGRRPPSARRPQGYPRATRWASLVNATWLAMVCAAVVVGSVWRLSGTAPRVEGLPVLVASAVAAVVMAAGAFLLRADNAGLARDLQPDGEGAREAGEALGVRVALLDTAGDAVAAAGVAVAGGVILVAHGLYWLDPAIALVVSLALGGQALVLVRSVGRALRAGN